MISKAVQPDGSLKVTWYNGNNFLGLWDAVTWMCPKMSYEDQLRMFAQFQAIDGLEYVEPPVDGKTPEWPVAARNFLKAWEAMFDRELDKSRAELKKMMVEWPQSDTWRRAALEQVKEGLAVYSGAKTTWEDDIRKLRKELTEMEMAG